MSTPEPVLRLLGRAAEPGLESSLTAVRLGLQPLDAVLPVLPAWPLILLSADRERPQPLIVGTAGGPPLIAAFTSPDRTGGVDGRGRWQLWLRTSVIALGAKGDVGLVINPGSEPTVVIPGDRLRAMVVASAAKGAPSDHPPGSRALTALEQTIMAFRAASTPKESVFDAVASADLLVVSATDPAKALDPAAVGGALAVFTDETMIPAELRGSWLVRTRGADLAALAGEGFDRIVVDPNTAYSLVIPLAVVPR